MKEIKRNLRILIDKFAKENNCQNIVENLVQLIKSDEVCDYVLVREHKKMFNWQLREELSIINNERELAGLKPIKINQIETDLLEDEFCYQKQINNDWQKHMRTAIYKIKGKK